MKRESDEPPLQSAKDYINSNKSDIPATGHGDSSRMGFWGFVEGIYLYGGRNVPVSTRRMALLVSNRITETKVNRR